MCVCTVKRERERQRTCICEKGKIKMFVRKIE